MTESGNKLTLRIYPEVIGGFSISLSVKNIPGSDLPEVIKSLRDLIPAAVISLSAAEENGESDLLSLPPVPALSAGDADPEISEDAGAGELTADADAPDGAGAPEDSGPYPGTAFFRYAAFIDITPESLLSELLLSLAQKQTLAAEWTKDARIPPAGDDLMRLYAGSQPEDKAIVADFSRAAGLSESQVISTVVLLLEYGTLAPVNTITVSVELSLDVIETLEGWKEERCALSGNIIALLGLDYLNSLTNLEYAPIGLSPSRSIRITMHPGFLNAIDSAAQKHHVFRRTIIEQLICRYLTRIEGPERND